MKVLCKRNYHGFKRGQYYDVDAIHSIFLEKDFITIECPIVDTDVVNYAVCLHRFLLRDICGQYVDEYLGYNESKFKDYFCDLKDERKLKLEFIIKNQS